MKSDFYRMGRSEKSHTDVSATTTSSRSARPLLTLAVPTYNRSGCLRELLSVLVDQLRDEPRVELLISDNASTDDTPAVVQNFVARGLRIRCIRNQENVGADANFLQCFEQARGKYVWLFSDDDVIIPGGLTKILKYCEDPTYDLMWVNGFSFAESPFLLQPRWTLTPSRSPVLGNLQNTSTFFLPSFPGTSSIRTLCSGPGHNPSLA